MRYTFISVGFTTVLLCLLSCRVTLGEQHDGLQKENVESPNQEKHTALPIPGMISLEPSKNLKNKDLTNKKKKASDTPRPKVAVL